MKGQVEGGVEGEGEVGKGRGCERERGCERGGLTVTTRCHSGLLSLAEWHLTQGPA